MISAQQEKIAAIRMLREFVANEFGTCPGLRETKDFVDSFAVVSHNVFVKEQVLRECSRGELLQSTVDAVNWG